MFCLQTVFPLDFTSPTAGFLPGEHLCGVPRPPPTPCSLPEERALLLFLCLPLRLIVVLQLSCNQPHRAGQSTFRWLPRPRPTAVIFLSLFHHFLAAEELMQERRGELRVVFPNSLSHTPAHQVFKMSPRNWRRGCWGPLGTFCWGTRAAKRENLQEIFLSPPHPACTSENQEISSVVVSGC